MRLINNTVKITASLITDLWSHLWLNQNPSTLFFKLVKPSNHSMKVTFTLLSNLWSLNTHKHTPTSIGCEDRTLLSVLCINMASHQPLVCAPQIRTIVLGCLLFVFFLLKIEKYHKLHSLLYEKTITQIYMARRVTFSVQGEQVVFPHIFPFQLKGD